MSIGSDKENKDTKDTTKSERASLKSPVTAKEAEELKTVEI
ncbi:hypothetical protein A1F94_000720 [Pyrenophora tritici-repentis]|nr:hypothetical protein A1F94_000720 [Pyrenophora tritici-repentis]